uniref:ZP domain-containing protein n=1 Tax=Oryzias sinensis TaxID=183150 RepID=A0A8C7XVY8_9TELE
MKRLTVASCQLFEFVKHKAPVGRFLQLTACYSPSFFCRARGQKAVWVIVSCLFLFLSIVFRTSTSQTFRSSGEINLSSCPIHFYGQRYEKAYVNRFALCFKASYGRGADNDCILMSGGTADRGDLSVLTKEIPTGSGTFQASETNRGIITDVSGCRLSGSVYLTNTTIQDLRTCSTITCDVNGVAKAVPKCGPNERCQGDGSCAWNSVCSVTASTIIDFSGKRSSIPDRCGYSLLRSPSLPGLHVTGVFKERRRRDMSLVDRVILNLDGNEISLEQGGRVKVLTDFKLPLSSSPLHFHGVELSKDQADVTAKIAASNFTVTVLFDGSSAAIHLTGPNGATFQGLCENSTTLRQVRVSQYSTADCNAEYQDAPDSSINCNNTVKWCDVLQRAPFDICSSNINPQPFMSACSETLCKYPAKDGLECQFLEAYAKACQLHSGVRVEGWRTQTSYCTAFTACQKICSSHEFCGLDSHSQQPRCLCRAIFASKYKPIGRFGEPIVCEKKSASVVLANCLLEDEQIDYTTLHLNDQTCRGEMDNMTHMVTFGFDTEKSCGTLIMANDTQIVYKNAIMTKTATTGEIVRHEKLRVDFSCYLSQPEVKSLAMRSMIQHVSSGQWSYNLTMKAYTSSDLTTQLDEKQELDLNQQICVELKTEGLDGNAVSVVTDSCWATDQPSPTGNLRYDLIKNSCPNPDDETIKVMGNGQGTSNYFCFNTFQFSGRNSEVFLHCKVELCIKQGDNCVQVRPVSHLPK